MDGVVVIVYKLWMGIVFWNSKSRCSSFVGIIKFYSIELFVVCNCL